jgi:hypothetical protein
VLEYLDANGDRATIDLPPTGQATATVVNLTPHPIRLYASVREDGIDDLEPHLRNVIPPQPTPARLTIRERRPHNGIEQVEYGHAIDLPPERDGYRYIVSLVVALALTGQRTDLLVPYFEVRNATGTVIGCRALAQPVLPHPQDPQESPVPGPRVATPDGCRFCGITQRVHGRQHVPEQGWHAWMAPTDQQRLDRMRARRDQEARRLLTPNEHDRVWYAIEGAAGEPGADPGTILKAVLNALDIDAPTLEDELADSLRRRAAAKTQQPEEPQR